MLIPRTFLRLTAIAGLVWLSVFPALGASSSADSAAEMLANFPALRRLSAAKSDGAIRTYLTGVSASFHAAGYVDFARGLPDAASMVELFGQPDRAKIGRNLSRARATLRDLQAALAKSASVPLPVVKGKSIPNYRAIANAFLSNANRALTNLGQGLDVLNFLRKKDVSFWLVKPLPGSFNFVFNASAGSIHFISGSSKAYVALIPVDSDSSTIVYTAGGNYLTGMLTLTNVPPVWDGFLFSTGTIPLNYPSLFLPEVTFADAAVYAHLAGANLYVTGVAGTHWVALPEDAALPGDGECGAGYFVLDELYTVNGRELPTGTRIYRVDDGFATPPVAIELPAAALTALPGGAPTPTPTPSPTP